MKKEGNGNVLYVDVERNISVLVPHFIKQLLKNSCGTYILKIAFQGIRQ